MWPSARASIAHTSGFSGCLVADTARPVPPAGLAGPGSRLWTAIIGDLEAGWRLDARELALLERACRMEDRISDLEAEVERDGAMIDGSRMQRVLHPAIPEVRQLDLARLRLLAALDLADPKSGVSSSPRSSQARHAADARWARGARREAMRNG
jgi:terminase small subunit-like protein